MALTFKQASTKLGPATLKIERLQIPVEVIDYVPAYGTDRWTVEPITGSGTQNVETFRLTWEN
jgi:hypothetical protein